MWTAIVSIVLLLLEHFLGPDKTKERRQKRDEKDERKRLEALEAGNNATAAHYHSRLLKRLRARKARDSRE